MFSLHFFLSLQSLDGKVQFVFKKVAVVEKFFDIIYSVHVESESGEAPHLRGRAGKHCGQKRTYRAVSDGINTLRLNILYRWSRASELWGLLLQNEDGLAAGCSSRLIAIFLVLVLLEFSSKF